MVPAGDAAALADAMGQLLDDSETRTTLGQRARARCMSEFSWDVCAARLVNHYRLAIEKGARTQPDSIISAAAGQRADSAC